MQGNNFVLITQLQMQGDKKVLITYLQIQGKNSKNIFLKILMVIFFLA